METKFIILFGFVGIFLYMLYNMLAVLHNNNKLIAIDIRNKWYKKFGLLETLTIIEK